MHHYTVKNTQRTSPDTLLITLRPKRTRDTFDFEPGQYAAIGYRRGIRPSPMRCFSIVSSPNRSDELQFAMRIYGDFTQNMAQLSIGDAVFVRGPFGSFVVDKEYDRNLILLTGGIGVTPFMSMIREATESRSTTPITLLYSCQSQDNIPFYEELLDLERQNKYLRVIFFISSGGVDRLQAGRIMRGRIGDTHLQQLTNSRYNQFSYFICGPKGFMKGMTALLAEHDIDSDRIVTEEFTPTSQAGVPSLLPAHSVSRLTYGVTGVSMVLGIVAIMALDLITVVPKEVNAQVAQNPTNSQAQAAASSTSSDNSSTAATSTPTDMTSSGVSTTQASTSVPTQTYTQPTPVYQAPVTSVS